MAIVRFEQRGKVIQVTWENGRCESFHYIWLRDNAPIADNLDPNTEERLVDFHTFPLVPRPSTISLDNSGNPPSLGDLGRWAIRPAGGCACSATGNGNSRGPLPITNGSRTSAGDSSTSAGLKQWPS